jgi:hypothetical protein
MKELLLFRIFALFPFIGISAPDLANALHISFASVPAEHVIVDITLAACLLICSAGIWLLETKELKISSKLNEDYTPVAHA